MDKVTKYFRGKVRSIDPATYTADVVISDETKDRYDERVLVGSFKKTKSDFMKHPVLLSSHAYRGLMNQIGMFEDIKIDSKNKEVVGKVKWFVGEGNPEADWGFKLAEHGIAAFSIGFIPKKSVEYGEEDRKKNGGIYRDFEEIELLETSQVLIPANPSALMKSFGDDGVATEDQLFLKELSDQIVAVFKDGEATEEIKWDGVASDDTTLNEETPTATKEGQDALEVKPETVGEKAVPATPILVSIDTTELKKVLGEFLTAFTAAVAEYKAQVLAPVEPQLPEKITDVVLDEEPDPATEEALKDIIGDEKMAELRSLMVGEPEQPKDFTKIKSMFDDMTKELTGIFSVQQ
jgi:hypothetical protein